MIKKKIVTASFFGNALEFYDFTIYGVFASVLGRTFFPSDDPLNSLLMSWGAFAAGFLMRPFGATIFGFIGDKLGRKKALSLSIVFMGLPTLLIGVLPSYATIGIIAPILVILCRLLQGICTGGEYNGAAIFSLEHSPENKKGLVSGLITSSCVFGALTATGLGAVFINLFGDELAWRYLFVLGSLISLLGYFMRKSMPESPEFNQPTVRKSYFSHIIETIVKNKQSFVIAVAFGGLNGVLSYTLFGFLNVWLTRYHGYEMSSAMFVNVFGLLSFFFCSIAAGKMFDIMGGQRYFMMAILTVICLPLVFFSIMESSNIVFVVLAQIGFGTLVGMIAGPQHAFLQNLFPASNRYSGVAFSFCLGMGIVGGNTPLMATYLIEKTNYMLMPAMLVSALALVAFVLLLQFRCSQKKAAS